MAVIASLEMVCASVVGLCVTSCFRYPWQLQHLCPIGPLPLTCSGCRHFSIGPHFPPSHKTKCSSNFSLLNKNISSRGRLVQSFSRLVDARSPSSFVIESSLLTARFSQCKPGPCRKLDRGDPYLHVKQS